MQSSQLPYRFCILLILAGWIPTSWEPVAFAADDSVDFASQIQPILARRCYACHGPDQQESSVRFDDRATLIGAADSGSAAIVPGKPNDSELIKRVRDDADSGGERMPPEGKPLSEAEIDLLSRWITSGAEYDEHWAFKPLSRPPVPETKNTQWAREPIDSFVLEKLEQADLAPVAEAKPADLIRRVYLDVTGLPPEPEVVADLCRDWSEVRYAELVDRLLAAPAFGERWARMWLDVVRYAETNSFERDGAKPNAWKYRDYVIAAMSSDKPFDQFIREQLAGDEMDEVSPETLTATGYFRLGLWDDEPADPLQAEFDAYDDLVTTTSQAFLGLTLNCARCHDHKIDPLLQKDYYSMVAFLRDVTPYASRSDQTTNNQIDIDPQIAQLHRQLEERLARLEKSVRQVEREAIKKMDAADQRATEGPEREQTLKQKLKQFLSENEWLEYSQQQSEIRELRREQSRLPRRETVLGLAKVDAQPKPTYVLLRGSPHSEGDVVEPTFPKLLGGGTPSISAGDRSPGRRRALADWIAADDNWMTARVIANRLWHHYFGRGIVGTPNNFGLMGDPPSHPDLLNFLASELVADDWRLKRLHRRILLSSTYRLGSQTDAEAEKRDPSNQLLWRQNLRRLSAEQVRDSVLAISGQLNEQQFGESMYPQLSDEVLSSQSRPGQGWHESSAADRARRSIYIHVKRSLPVPLLTAFDFPETDISCEARFLTIQPAQALTMLNSQWMQEQAAALYDRVQREVGTDLHRQAERCLELTTSKQPEPGDVAELLQLVERLIGKFGLENDRARKAMCLVSMNINPFFYID